MPTYEYECEGCGHRFDEFQSMTAPRLKTCPKCKKPKLKRLIGAGAGVIFKGSGFYVTDYKKGGGSGSSGSSTESKSSDAKDGGSKPSGSSDSSSSGAADKSCGSCGKTGPDVCD